MKKFNSHAKTTINSGFGNNATNYGGRFINPSGNANVGLNGVPFLNRISWFHTLLNLSRAHFIFLVFAFYFLINLVFAAIYYQIGVENLRGISSVNEFDKFGQAFFFSIQTFTTVGYGHINPSGFLASVVAAIEALFGLLSFAIATGLFYGRFSKPQAFIKFSENVLIAPFKNGKALMFRICPYKNTNLTDVEVKITLAYQLEENGEKINKFFPLSLDIEKINALTLSWTLVHEINEDSPLFGLTADDYKTNSGEIIILAKSFEDMFCTTVFKRSSYVFSDVIYGAKFLPMFSRNNDNSKTILHVDQLNSFEKVDLAV